jgi:hypothetical protein
MKMTDFQQFSNGDEGENARRLENLKVSEAAHSKRTKYTAGLLSLSLFTKVL